jgi:hypothetical protein
MKQGVKKYFDIELEGFHKTKRNQLHLELIDELINDSPAFEDISFLLDEAERKEITIRQPFFEEIIYPVLQKEISRNNLKAIKHLIKLEQNLWQLHHRKKEYEPTTRQLFLKGLEINPDDKELLELYELDLRNYLRHAIHEIPHGVLYGMDGANANQCDELLEVLNDYKKVCGKLSLGRNELINECKFHFQNYKAYLQKANEFAGYKAFLEMQTEISN